MACTSQSSLHNLCNILLITIKKGKEKSILRNQDLSCFFYRDALLRFRHICVFIKTENLENTFEVVLFLLKKESTTFNENKTPLIVFSAFFKKS